MFCAPNACRADDGPPRILPPLDSFRQHDHCCVLSPSANKCPPDDCVHVMPMCMAYFVHPSLVIWYKFDTSEFCHRYEPTTASCADVNAVSALLPHHPVTLLTASFLPSTSLTNACDSSTSQCYQFVYVTTSFDLCSCMSVWLYMTLQ